MGRTCNNDIIHVDIKRIKINIDDGGEEEQYSRVPTIMILINITNILTLK